MKKSKVKANKFGWFWLVFVVLALFFGYYGFFKGGGESGKIVLAEFSGDCELMVKLKSGNREKLNLSEKVLEKSCPLAPVISGSGDYAAFDLNLEVENNTMRSGRSANNITLVYMANTNSWVFAYFHGAGQAESLKFDENENLIIDLGYEGKVVTETVRTDSLVDVLEKEKALALELVKKESDVVKWLGNFNQSGENVKSNSRAVIAIDNNEGEYLLIHAYEQFNTDGRSATFNWYRFDRLNALIQKEFDY